MSTITKELAKLFRKITNSEIDAEGNAHVVLSPADSLLINNARIALASLEAEAVAFVMADDLKDSSIISTPAYRDLGEAMERTVGDVVALYAAPPAPVSVPDFDALRLLFEASERKSDHGFNLHKYGIGYADKATQARWEVWVACRAAMLQGADGNSPVIPDGVCPCCGRKPLKNRTCSVSGCDGKHVARGFCIKHYAIERKKDPSRRKSIRAADKRYRARKAAAPQQEAE